MSEIKARYISLIIIAIESITYMVLCGADVILSSVEIDYFRYHAYFDLFSYIVTLSVFLSIGILIILSAFYKIPFYIIIGIETILSFLSFCLLVDTGFHPLAMFICVLILAPQIYYYIVRIIILCQSKKS